MASDAPLGVGQSPRLLVVGNLLVDVILRDVAAMPVWGQEVVCSGRLEVVAGQGANLAFAAARLGVSTELIANVGEDAAGARIRRELEEAGIGLDGVEITPLLSTAMTVAAVRPDGERAFLSDLACLKEFDGTMLARHWSAARNCDVVALVGSSNLPSLDLQEAASMLADAKARGVVTVFDPGWDPGGWQPATLKGISAVLAHTDVFLPNLDEATALTHEQDAGLALQALAKSCPGTVVLKCGAAGSCCLKDGELYHAESLPVKVENAVGAGDVYDAGVIAGYLASNDILKGMLLGTAAASIYVSRRSNRFPRLAEAAEIVERVVITQEGQGLRD